MKKMFIVPMLIGLAMICSCQKQQSAAEQQLAQRKVELDAREEALAERKSALDEREKALAKREKALDEREKATANVRTIAPGVQGQAPDAAGIQAERDRRIQQLPPEFRALIPDRSRIQAEQAQKDRKEQERPAQTQRKSEAIQKWQMSGAAASPAAEVTSPIPSPTPQ